MTTATEKAWAEYADSYETRMAADPTTPRLSWPVFMAGYRAAIEDAAKIVHGPESQLYEVNGRLRRPALSDHQKVGPRLARRVRALVEETPAAIRGEGNVNA